MLDHFEKAKTLELLPQMEKIDAIQMSIKFQEVHNMRIDWHEFSYYLDELRQKGILKIVKPGGMTGYALNR